MPIVHHLALYLLLLLLAPDSSGDRPTQPALAFPHTCHWFFSGGMPTASSSCSPPPVRYRGPGVKPVTLTVCVAAPHGACATLTKTVTVLDPQPFVTGLKVEPAVPYVGDTLRLTASISGRPPLAVLWTLPGPATGRTNPALLATAHLVPGLLTIRLRASNASGSDTRTFYVRLQDPKPAVSALILSSPTPALGSIFSASSNATGRPPLHYLWTLDGSPLGNEETLVWTVAGVPPGPHILALRVSNSAGSASLARTLTVHQELITDFHPLCPNLLCLFSIGTPVAFDLVLDPAAHPTRYDYDWIGNGLFTESSPSPISTHVYSEPGNYRPRVRVTTAYATETRLSFQYLLVTR